eukprot:CAMPEP_0116887920 /NCGR_PEP_ID=MMETSP0463-20121206/22637_1 /TAXON_ID=181622 /ORGANISM="Strombidinopsis sp, Strain SopsisLIS2011" /LENGTH=61 /DNA_ID=CAMNT_0004551557 /DNA_START=68 /DNA_END=253 /DNA_ORIENTATION=-
MVLATIAILFCVTTLSMRFHWITHHNSDMQYMIEKVRTNLQFNNDEQERKDTKILVARDYV